MRELRRNFYSTVAARRHWALPLQRMRSLPQDERNESALGQAAASTGKNGRKRNRRASESSFRDESALFSENSSASLGTAFSSDPRVRPVAESKEEKSNRKVSSSAARYRSLCGNSPYALCPTSAAHRPCRPFSSARFCFDSGSILVRRRRCTDNRISVCYDSESKRRQARLANLEFVEWKATSERRLRLRMAAKTKAPLTFGILSLFQ